MRQYDVVILGGGLVGATLAIMLKGLKVAVVEAFKPSALERPLNFDERTTVISAKTKELFERLGTWGEMQSHAGVIKSIDVSDRGHFAGAELHANSLQVEGLGYVVPNPIIGRALFTQLGHVDLYAPDKAERVVPQTKGASVTLASGEQLHGGLVVIADGASSPLARSLGVSYDVYRYQHDALVGTLVADDTNHQQWAYERFTDEGAIALLPLPAHEDAPNKARYSFVWAMPHSTAEQRKKMTVQQLSGVVTERFGKRLGQLTIDHSPVRFELARSLADEQVRQGILLLGNSAHTLHPVAGQGFNLSARDCDVLARLIKRAASNGQPIGDLSLLNRYLELRQLDQWQVTQLSHHLSDLFSSQAVSIAAGRGLGTLGLTLSPTLKKLFAKSAMGYSYV